MTCECDALRAELARLRPLALETLLRRHLVEGSLSQARILARLYRAPAGEVVNVADLELAMPGEESLHENTVRVHVFRMRKALAKAIGGDIIETSKPYGYKLTADGRRMIDHIMRGGHPDDLPLCEAA